MPPADSDDEGGDNDGKAGVSGPSREDMYSAFHKGTVSSKKKKQVGGWVGGWVGACRLPASVRLRLPEGHRLQQEEEAGGCVRGWAIA